MNPTPEQANGWLSLIYRVGKTKEDGFTRLGAAILSFLFACLLAFVVYQVFIKDTIRGLNERIEKLEAKIDAKNIIIQNHQADKDRAVEEAKRNSMKELEDYYDLFQKMRGAIITADKTEKELERMKELYGN